MITIAIVTAAIMILLFFWSPILGWVEDWEREGKDPFKLDKSKELLVDLPKKIGNCLTGKLRWTTLKTSEALENNPLKTWDEVARKRGEQ